MTHSLSRYGRSLLLSPLALGMVGLLWGCSGGDQATTSDDGGGGSTQGGMEAGGSGGTSAGGTGGKAQGGAPGGSGGQAQAGAAQGGTAGTSGKAGTAGAAGVGGASGAGGAGGTGGAGLGGAGQGGAGMGGAATAGGAGGKAGTGGKAGGGMEGGDPAKFEVEMLFTTANIGREYKTKAEVQAVFDKVGDFLDNKSGPRFVGWQEIGEDDPCGDTCEIEAIDNRFKSTAGWDTRHPKGKRPDGGMETVKEPITSKGAGGDEISVRAVFASPGWAGVSPTRFVTVVHYAERNTSVVNAHFIAGAWSCENNADMRQEYWKKDWKVYKEEVAAEHAKGYNVIATGDLNRLRVATDCNPKWEPLDLHPDAKLVGGTGLDYIFAIPAEGHKFVAAKGADGTAKEGEITLGIDGHKAHWVSGQFLSK